MTNKNQPQNQELLKKLEAKHDAKVMASNLKAQREKLKTPSL